MNTFIKTISMWGDSIMRGVVLNNIRNRYEMLKASAASRCAELLNLDIHNNARFGCTITKGNKLLTQAIEKGLECDAVVFEFGGNDCDFNWGAIAADPTIPHDSNTPIEIFKQTYIEMIEAVRKNAIEPILLSLPPLSAVRYFEWMTKAGLDRKNILNFLGDVEQIYRIQERYSLAVSNIAMQLKCEYIDLRGAFLAHFDYTNLLCADGIHPNEQGHLVMTDAIVSFATERRAKRAGS